MDREIDGTDETSRKMSHKLILMLATVLALVAGVIDITSSIIAQSSVLFTFGHILPPLAATAWFFFISYLVVWYLFAAPLGRLFKIPRIPLAVAMATWIGSFFALMTLYGFSLSPEILVRAFLLLALSALPAAGAFALAKAALQSGDWSTKAAALSLSFPLVAWLTMLFLWVLVLRIETTFSVASFGLSLAFAAILILFIALVLRVRTTVQIKRAVFSLAVVVALGPLLTYGVSRRGVPSSPTYRSGHPIKHVIMIVVDTLRADALSCYESVGSQTPFNVPTPNIDQLASDGILFTDAQSAAPWTLPAMASIMTGLSPAVHMAVSRDTAVPDSARTLAEYMQNAGYRTAAMGSNPMLQSSYKIRQGFDEYLWYPKASDQTIGRFLLTKMFPQQYRPLVSTREITDMATGWIEANYEQDSFLWVHYYDPHHPYTPPAEFLPGYPPPETMTTGFRDRKRLENGLLMPTAEGRDWIRDLYLGEVRYVDHSIGRIVDTLKRLDIYEESLIIVTSDHGEEFWEHDGYGHGHTLYREVLWVPLIIKPPGSRPQKRVTNLVATQSVTPTVLDLCELEYDPTYLGARSLVPLWSDEPEAFESSPVYSTGLLYYEDRQSLCFDGFKYIVSRVTGKEEFFNRVVDLDEQHSIVRETPDELQHARDVLNEQGEVAKQAQKYFNITPTGRIKLDQETIRRLKTIGYM